MAQPMSQPGLILQVATMTRWRRPQQGSTLQPHPRPRVRPRHALRANPTFQRVLQDAVVRSEACTSTLLADGYRVAAWALDFDGNHGYEPIPRLRESNFIRGGTLNQLSAVTPTPCVTIGFLAPPEENFLTTAHTQKAGSINCAYSPYLSQSDLTRCRNK